MSDVIIPGMILQKNTDTPYRSFGRGDVNREAPADYLIVKILAMCKTFGHNDEAIEMLRKESVLIKKED